MTHGDIFKYFELYFPDYAKDKVDVWFQNGKNSIRIRQKNRQEFIFTYNGKDNWKFETIDSFMDGLRGASCIIQV